MQALATLKAGAISLLAVFVLSGCVTAPKPVTASQNEIEQIKHIQVLAMRFSEPDLLIMNNPGNSFGLIGAAIAESNRIPKRDALRGHLRAADFSHVQLLKDALDRSFATRGMTLHWPDQIMAPEKERKVKRDMWGMRKQYLTAREDMDAMLDVNFGFAGYAAAGAGKSAPYRPTVVVNVRLLDPSGKRVLMSDFFVHNNVFNQKQAVSIEPDDTHVYPDFDDLDAAGPASAEGLTAALNRIVESLQRQL